MNKIDQVANSQPNPDSVTRTEPRTLNPDPPLV